MIGSRHGGRVHFAHGFSGNGVAPAVFAGRVLAGLVDEPQGDLARLPIVDRGSGRFPPEPMRFAGVRVVREALIRRDEAEDVGRAPSALVRFLAGCRVCWGIGSARASRRGPGHRAVAND